MDMRHGTNSIRQLAVQLTADDNIEDYPQTFISIAELKDKRPRIRFENQVTPSQHLIWMPSSYMPMMISAENGVAYPFVQWLLLRLDSASQRQAKTLIQHYQSANSGPPRRRHYACSCSPRHLSPFKKHV